ncbi:unnamed protein product [Camellia sinensis]
MGRKRLKTIGEHHIQMSDTITGSSRRRPIAPFICYSRKELGERWKAFSSDEKKRFVEMTKASAEEHAKVVPCAPKSEKGKRQLCISLKSIVELVNRFNEAQKQAVIDIGIGGLLEMKCTRIDHDLCTWLVQNFDPDSSSLNVRDRQLWLTCEAVNVLLGIRCEGDDVQLAGSLEAYPNIYEEFGVVNRVIPLNMLRLYLTETDGAEDEFQRKFALYVLGAMLCPTIMTALKPSFIHVVKDMNGMRACNWAKLTLQFLHNGVCKYNSKGHRAATGCVFLLMVEFDYNNDESNANDADMDAHHVDNQQKGQYNEVCMSNVEFDIHELKEMMKKVKGNDVCIINLSSNVAELKEMLKQLLQCFSLGCNEPFAKQTNLGERKQILHHLIEGIFSRPQPAGVDKQCVNPVVGVEAHDDGVVKLFDEVNPIECNISDVQGVDHQQQNVTGTLAKDKIHFHDGHKLKIEEDEDNQKKGGLQSGETYETEDKYNPDLQSVGVKNVACDVHTSHTKLGQPLGATKIVRRRGKGRERGKGKGRMCGSGVQATEVGDMQLCIHGKTNSGVDDVSSPVDVEGVNKANKL